MLKVAQIQFDPQIGEIRSNHEKSRALLSQTGDARLVVLPELANSGYNFINKSQAEDLAETVTDSHYVSMLQDVASGKKKFIISGFHERDGDDLFNTSLFITPEGTIGKYRKIHLFMNEKQIFTRGNLGLPTFQMDDYRIGMLICFDYLFPEIWRIMGLKNVDLVAHPSNLVTYKAFKVVPAQSVINRFYILTTNRIGTERDVSFSGRSFITDPEGEVVAEMSDDREEVMITDINPRLARNKMITSGNHVFDDRLPELYGDVLKQSIAENDS
jgi:predicted amidohydrolase